MSSEFDFIANKSIGTIMDEMLATVNANIDKREGSVIYDAIAAVAVELADVYTQKIPAIWNACRVLTATSSDLDAWAEDFGVNRLEPQKTIYQISMSPSGSDLFIGEILRSHTTNELWEYIGDNKVESVLYGDLRENIGDNLEPQVEYPEISSIIFSGLVYAGRQMESDDSLRSRIINKLSSGSGGSVLQYVDLMLREDKDGKAESPWGCLVFPCGRRCGYVKIVCLQKDWTINSTTDALGNTVITECRRGISFEDCDKLKEWLDPVDSEGYGYGKCPIGHRAEVFPAILEYPLKFYIHVIYTASATDGMSGYPGVDEDGNPVIVYPVSDEIKADIFDKSMEYINDVIDKGFYTQDGNTPDRRGNRYRLMYISSNHNAHVSSYLRNKYPGLIEGLQISYSTQSGEHFSWVKQSDDILQIKNTHKKTQIFQISPEYNPTKNDKSKYGVVFGMDIVGSVRSEDSNIEDW